MEKEQELEWFEAQKITISADLVAAAKKQMEFLAAVDRRRCLYDGPVLERAIHRYKARWLPLLAKYTESWNLEGRLVVPLDCEWIWHCHRLNPVQYKRDCEKFYGRILDNRNVESSLSGESKDRTVALWSKLFPEEPFELDLSSDSSEIKFDKCSEDLTSITYDLASAVKRQSSFYYQVSRPSMLDGFFVKEAVARYKGFLHLIKRNLERSMKRFCVPTYDVDLMWHSHQLQPLSYCKDMVELLGRVLEHDDTDSDRSKGKKLDVGFSDTTKQWEDTYGSSYWRAGAMYKGSVPSPLLVVPYSSNCESRSEVRLCEYQKHLYLPQMMVVEVLLEIVGLKNLTTSQKGNLFVTFSKKEPDMFLDGSCVLGIRSESGQKQVVGFQCEATGELVLTLMSDSPSNLLVSKHSKTIGKTSISLENLFYPEPKLSIEKWFELKHHSGNMDSNPVSIRVSASFSIPAPAPYAFHMVKSHPLSVNACFLPLAGKAQQFKPWSRFVLENGNEILSVQMRNARKLEGKGNLKCDKEVIGLTRFSRKPKVLAEYAKNVWSLKDPNFALCIEEKASQDGHIFELKGDRQIKLFLGKKLEYEARNCNKHTDYGFITVVEFSTEYPYGKALALLGLKSGLLKVAEEWFVLPGILMAFILSNMFKKQGYDAFISTGELVKPITSSAMATNGHVSEDKTSSPASELNALAVKTNGALAIGKGGGCGSKCGGNCSNALESGDYGSRCRGNCVDVVNAGDCGSKCGGNCSNALETGDCGKRCRGSCKDVANASACGSCAVDYSSCRDVANASACGSCAVDYGSCKDVVNVSACGSCAVDYGSCKDVVNASACGSCAVDYGSCKDVVNVSACGACHVSYGSIATSNESCNGLAGSKSGSSGNFGNYGALSVIDSADSKGDACGKCLVHTTDGVVDGDSRQRALVS